MKTFKTTQPLILILSCLFILESCCICKLCQPKIRHHESESEEKWHDTTSNLIRRQLIVSFPDAPNIGAQHSAFLNNDDSVTIVDSCGCGKLFLLHTAPEIIPEGLVASRPQKPGHEGATFFNLDLNLNVIPRKSISLATLLKQNEERRAYIPSPTVKSVDTKVNIALIDAGLPADDIFMDKIWRNPAENKAKNNIDDDGNCYIDDIAGYDFTTNTGDIGTSINKHGSMVGQIILKSLADGPKVSIMDLKVFDENGKGNLFDALCAIDYAIENGADFINLSWGYYRKTNDTLASNADSLLLYYINKANEKGIPIFASAGNDTTNTDTAEYHYPSGFFNQVDLTTPDNLISVAALDSTGNNLANYSNYGTNSVLISAKGAHSVKDTGFLLGGDIAGTSYATPHALGYAAQILAVSPGITPLELKNCLVQRSHYMGFPIKSEGKINVFDTRKCE